MTARATTKTRRRAGRADERGVALLLALLFVVLMTALVVEYAYETHVEASFVENTWSRFEAEVAARSAVAAGFSLLAADVEEAAATAATGRGSSDYDSLQDVWAQGLPYQPINDAVMQCRIQDEYGKLNLNALFQPGGNEENEMLVEAVRHLLTERGADDGVVDAILDWIDPDDEVRGNGAEAEFYTTLEVPYGCKNGPVESVEELLLVRGMTPEIFFGDPEDEEQLPLTELFTPYGDPTGKVNVNTAKYEVLRAVAYAMGNPGYADVWRDSQEGGTVFRDMDELQQFIPRDERDRPRSHLLLCASRVFRVEGYGVSGKSMVRIEAYVWRDPGVEAEMFRMLDWRMMQ